VIVALSIVGATITVNALDSVSLPDPLFTTKSCVPTVKFGKIAVIEVPVELTLTLVNETPLIVTVVCALTKLVPVIVTVPPAVTEPVDGEIPVIVGAEATVETITIPDPPAPLVDPETELAPPPPPVFAVPAIPAFEPEIPPRPPPPAPPDPPLVLLIQPPPPPPPQSSTRCNGATPPSNSMPPAKSMRIIGTRSRNPSSSHPRRSGSSHGNFSSLAIPPSAANFAQHRGTNPKSPTPHTSSCSPPAPTSPKTTSTHGSTAWPKSKAARRKISQHSPA